MTESTDHPTELFLRSSRRSMAALLVIVLLLGAAALSLMLSPTHAVFRVASQASLAAVGIVSLVTLWMVLARRRFAPDSAEVKVVMEDEWRRTNILRASRAALIAVLIAQYPLVLLFGFGMDLPAPRGAFAMAAATITLGLGMLLALFLYFDRE